MAGALKSVVVSDDVDAADSGETKVSVFNTATDAGSLDVYLTQEDDDLSSATPLATAVAGGAQSSYAAVTAGTYRLRVTGADDTSDLRLDISGLSLASQAVVSLVMTPGSGGCAGACLQIVQGGAVTPLLNTQARVRAVAALPDSGKLSLSAGGTTLIALAPSPAIGAYTLVDAGTVAVTGTVGGTDLTTGTQAITAGSDVTLMVYGSTASPTLSVISDDNRLPTTSTKLKAAGAGPTAMTGMESYPLTMTVDYSVVASSVAEGTASSPGALASSTTAALDVSSSAASTALYSLTDLTLSAQGVYTVFMFGTADAATGALRKER